MQVNFLLHDFLSFCIRKHSIYKKENILKRYISYKSQRRISPRKEYLTSAGCEEGGAAKFMHFIGTFKIWALNIYSLI